MKWKMAVAAMAAAAVVSAPAANAAPANGSGNGSANSAANRTTTSIGQTISAIAKSGGGAAGILSKLSELKPGNLGLLNALQRVTAPKTTTTTTTTDTPAS